MRYKEFNMIIVLLYICIISIFFFDWFYFVLGIGNRYMTWTPEFISFIMFLYIPLALAVRKEWRLPRKYTLLLIIYMCHIAIGIVSNPISSGPMIAGIRQFCKFLPIFVLPAVVRFEERQIKNLIHFVFFLALIQFPVTLWQRFIRYAHESSGDRIGGTLGFHTSGTLSVFLLMVLSFLTASYLRKKISLRLYIMLSAIIFIPTTLNETKVTLLLLPMSFLIPAFLSGEKKKKKITQFIAVTFLFSGILFLFITIYDSFSNRDILQFYSQEDRVGNYSEGRLVPILTALDKIFHSDPKTFLFGYGAGNVSVSFSKSMESKLLKKLSVYNPDNVSTTKLLWETGYGGTFLVFLLIAFVFFDSLKMSKEDNFLGTFAVGMAVSMIILTISFFYTRAFNANVFSFLFFFFNGFLVSYYNFNEGGEI